MTEFLPLIIEHEGEALTTSRAVAENFGKRHNNIIRAIEQIFNDGNALENEGSGLNFELANPENEPESNQPNFRAVDCNQSGGTAAKFLAANFRLSEYTDAQGKPRKQYIITKDGFALLAMGFTGAKALQFKIAYINAFNRMERLIHGQGVPLIGSNLAESPQALAGAAQTDPLEKECALFIKALVNALSAGECALVSRSTPRGSDPVNTIGEYSGTAVLLAYKPAVTLYRAYSPAALSNEALKAALVSTGRAAAPTTHRASLWADRMHIRTIRGRRVSAVELIRGRNPALDEYLRNIDR